MRRQKYFNGQDKQKLKLLIQEKTGYCIRSDYVLSQAFRRRSFCVEEEGNSNEMLASIVDEWGISEYLIVGRSDEKNRVDQQIKVKADLLESIIGAIAVDSKWDPVVLETAVKNVDVIRERAYMPTIALMCAEKNQ